MSCVCVYAGKYFLNVFKKDACYNSLKTLLSFQIKPILKHYLITRSDTCMCHAGRAKSLNLDTSIFALKT